MVYLSKLRVIHLFLNVGLDLLLVFLTLAHLFITLFYVLEGHLSLNRLLLLAPLVCHTAFELGLVAQMQWLGGRKAL